jgi:hypothetical protein
MPFYLFISKAHQKRAGIKSKIDEQKGKEKK